MRTGAILHHCVHHIAADQHCVHLDYVLQAIPPAPSRSLSVVQGQQHGYLVVDTAHAVRLEVVQMMCFDDDLADGRCSARISTAALEGGLLFYLLLRELPRHPRPQEDIGVDFVGQREVPSERG